MRRIDKRRYYFFIFLIAFPVLSFAQGEANNWYFGDNAGISFNTSPPTVLTNGQLSTNEGCSSISNPNGDLLFYTDGRTIWNANHQIMSNADYFEGTGLWGDPSSTSSGLIVQHPTEPDLYFVFTVDEPHHDNAFAFPNQGPANPNGTTRSTYSDTNLSIPQVDDGFNNGFAYSVVDMSLNGGLGDVVTSQKNQELITYDPNNSEDKKYKCSEKITAVRGENCNSVWVITHFKDTFYAFFIDENGLDENPVTSQVGPLVSTDDYRRAAIGYLKASPNGDKLITANQTMDYNPVNDNDQGTGNVYLFDFDSTTGEVSNPIELISDVRAYSVEFSPKGTKAYASLTQDAGAQNVARIVQWDLNATDIPNSQVFLSGVSGEISGAIQLAPNGKIYRSRFGRNSLAVINNPELPGNQADYTELISKGAINLGRQARFGLPPFIQSLFASRIDIVGTETQQLDLCDGESFTLSYDDLPNADYAWSLDGQILSGDNSSTLQISQPAGVELPYQETYTLDVNLNDGSCGRVGIANVTYFPFPEANSTEFIKCLPDSSTQNITEFDLNQINSQLVSNSSVLSDLEFTYYKSLKDAENNGDPIENPSSFENTSNPQTLAVVIRNSVSNCSSVTEFSLKVSNFETNNFSLQACDDNQDGFQTFDLTSIESQKNLTANAFYLTENDALVENNQIDNPEQFTIENPFQQTIYFTIENGKPCKDLGILSLEVIELPQLEPVESIFYCKEDFPNPIVISSKIPNDQVDNFEYFWMPGNQITSEIKVNEAGTYEVAVTDLRTGCVNFRSIKVLEIGLAEFSLEIEEFSRNQNTVTIDVFNDSVANYEFTLDDPSGTYQDEPVFNNVLPGIHNIFVRDKTGCGIVQKTFGVIGVMQFFTPNNDGINDFWGFKGILDNNQPSALVFIFDRYGKLLKSFKGLDKSWDGTFNGKSMPSQDYWYKIELDDGRSLTGHFTLKR